MRAALDLIENAVFVKDDHHRFVIANIAGCALLGRVREEIIGRTDHDILPAAQADRHRASDLLILKTGVSEQQEEALTDASGKVRNLLIKKSLFQLSRRQRFILVHIRDLTEFKHTEALLRYNAEHDSLTGLPNAWSFQQTVNELLAKTPDGHETAVILIDLDRFRNFNDAFGRTTGDNLLVQFAQRLSAVAQPSHLIARLGSDEFAVVQHLAGQPMTADELGATILKHLSTPFLFGANRIHLSASIGIAVARQKDDRESLHRRAELALRQAKREGPSRRRLFEAEMEVPPNVDPRLEYDLKIALQEKQLSIVYQPFARVSDLAILGYEALLRWTHPTVGPIAPSVFIPLAESDGFIIPMGEWVLREACKQALNGPQHHTIAINVSPIQFTRTDLNVGRKHEANAIISAMLRLTRTLELRVVAEGVETLEQLTVLRRQRCEAFQGFLLGQPVSNPFNLDKT
jgi:diguanylate cyclase (GGDEF)-like protein/PAS domain S-box-containing protein